MFAKQTEYAIRSLVYILLQNNEGRRPGYREIARAIRSPEQFLAKILQNLTRNNMLDSAKGRGGGFFFASPASTLTLKEIVRITEGERQTTQCGFGWDACDPGNPCPMHENYAQVREELNRMLSNVSIQSLAGKIVNHEAVLINGEIFNP